MWIKNPTQLVQEILKETIVKGDVVADATCGNGNDTVFLAECVGPNGLVYAFDVQSQAVKKTEQALEKRAYTNRVKLILDGHEHIDQYVDKPLACVMYNLGYLPGGDKRIQTKPETTIRSIQKSLCFLKKGGLISLIVYYGINTGTNEKDGVLSYLSMLDHKAFTVLKMDYVNRRNDPPLPILIEKL